MKYNIINCSNKYKKDFKIQLTIKSFMMCEKLLIYYGYKKFLVFAGKIAFPPNSRATELKIAKMVPMK